MNHTLNVKAVNIYKLKPDTEREFKGLDLVQFCKNYKKCIWMYMKEFSQT